MDVDLHAGGLRVQIGGAVVIKVFHEVGDAAA